MNYHCKANLQFWYQRKAIRYNQRGGVVIRESLPPPPPLPLLLCLHLLPRGITPHFPSPFQITDLSRSILHEHLPLFIKPQALNLSHIPVNLNLFHRPWRRAHEWTFNRRWEDTTVLGLQVG